MRKALNKDIFEFLNAYNEEEQIDRLLVSAFIDKHKITKVKINLYKV